jgi:hypothetical protein
VTEEGKVSYVKSWSDSSLEAAMTQEAMTVQFNAHNNSQHLVLILQDAHAGPVAPELKADTEVIAHPAYLARQRRAILLESGDNSLELKAIDLEKLLHI